MRILLCDYHVLLAEALAYVLTAGGREVVGVTRDLPEAAAAVKANQVDILLLDIGSDGQPPLDGLAELHQEVHRTHVVLLADRIDRALIRAARTARVRAITDKHQPMTEIIYVLDRVYAGERVFPPLVSTGPAAPAQRCRATNDAYRLATFLTPREREVLTALVCGDDTTKVARTLGITTATARCHIQCLLTKMGAHSRLQVATAAVRHGMVHPETGEWLVGFGAAGVRRRRRTVARARRA
jgi:DNA-binding NarL/FixJ family response regulator